MINAQRNHRRWRHRGIWLYRISKAAKAAEDYQPARLSLLIELVSIGGNLAVLLVVALLVDFQLNSRNESFIANESLTRQRENLLMQLSTDGVKSLYYCHNYRELEPWLRYAQEEDIYPRGHLTKQQVRNKYEDYVEKYFDSADLSAICLQISITFKDVHEVSLAAENLANSLDEFQDRPVPVGLHEYDSWLVELDRNAAGINSQIQDLIRLVANNM